jgi:hypothetical protein
MTLTCNQCGVKFQSVILDRQVALATASEMLAKHFMEKHANIVSIVQEKLAKAMMLVNNRLVLSSFLAMDQIDENDTRQTYIFDAYNKAQEDLMELLDFDPFEVEETEKKESD